jgi:hypothetical protein
MSTYRYGGNVEQIYPNYVDKAKGSTLVAAPGQSYDVEQVTDLTVPDGEGGMAVLALPMPPDEQWTKAPIKKNEQKADS